MFLRLLISKALSKNKTDTLLLSSIRNRNSGTVNPGNKSLIENEIFTRKYFLSCQTSDLFDYSQTSLQQVINSSELRFHSQIKHNERPHISLRINNFTDRFACSMSGFGVNANQRRIITFIGSLQGGCKFE